MLSDAARSGRWKHVNALRRYLSANGISDVKFARQLTAYRGNRRRAFAADVGRWASGSYPPGGITREEIEVVTNGSVKVSSWPKL